MEVKIVKYDKEFLKLSWKWLNDEELKKLTMSSSFSKKDQLIWYNSLEKKKNYCVWGIMVDKNRIGACGLKNITKSDCEYWCYIGEKSYWGQGIGKIVLQLTENEVRKLNIKSIWLKVVKNNYRAIKLYQSNDYLVEKELKKILLMRKII